jgi:hypothetical protein
MQLFCPESRNARTIVDGFLLMCESYHQVFLTGPQGSEFHLLLKEYVITNGTSADEIMHLQPSILEERFLADLVNMTPQGKDPILVSIELEPGLDLINERVLLRFLDNPSFHQAKLVVCMPGFDPYSHDHAYPETLSQRAKDALFIMPALRDRPADIAHFFRNLIQAYCGFAWRTEPLVVDENAIDLILEYPWPGNYGELQWVARILASTFHAEKRITRSRLEDVLLLGRTSPIS